MKSAFVHLVTAFVFLLSPIAGYCQTAGAANGQCSIFIDNNSFPLKEISPVTAVTAEPSGLDGMSARTIVNIAVAGNTESETIQLSVALTEPISPGSAGFNILLNHNSTAYALVKGDESNIEITDFIWSMDRKSFMLSLNFDCILRNTASSADGNKDIHLKGKLMRVQVVAPGIVCASN